MHDGTHVLAGDCTTTFDGTRRHRGDMLVVCKPDNTVLVHDADGYRPVAWLTRADAVAVEDDVLRARDGDTTLRVTVHDEYGGARYPASTAGVPFGDCPDCGGRLLRVDDAVACTSCDRHHGLPSDAEAAGGTCDCGLPTVVVERGRRFEICPDRGCDPLDERVRAAFDGEWDCPDCDGALRILRRGGLLAGCERYPDCRASFALPTGVVDGDRPCGLPAFETASGRRCPDSSCRRPDAPADAVDA